MALSSYTGLAIGGPLDGNVLTHHASEFVVAKVDNPRRMLSQLEVDHSLVETVTYTYVLLLAQSRPFGLFIASTLTDASDEPPLVTGVRELVKRYADTTPNKAVPAAQSEKRRH